MIRSAEQHQEECPISLVFGSGSAAFRTVHNDLPFRRAHAPPPYAAALFQERFKNRKLIRHCDRSLVSLVLCRSSQVQGLQQVRQNCMKFGDDLIGLCPEVSAQRRVCSCDAEHLPRKNNLKLKAVGRSSSPHGVRLSWDLTVSQTATI